MGVKKRSFLLFFNNMNCHIRCQFHQRFYVQIFHTYVFLAAFSSYVLALAKNLYEKFARSTLMKLTVGVTNGGRKTTIHSV